MLLRIIIFGWYKESALTNKWGRDDTITGDTILYGKFDISTYKDYYLDVSLFSGWTISNTNTYIYAYSSTYGTYNKAWPGKTLLDYGATFLNNSLYKLSIDDNYDYFIINNNDKQTDSIATKDSSSKIRKYIYLTNNTRVGAELDGWANGKSLYTVTYESNLGNLLKAQKASSMYRFTFGVNNTNRYGFKFIFINSSNQSTIKYLNFSSKDMLTEIKLGSTLYTTSDGYSGYYALTLKETLTSYSSLVVLAYTNDLSAPLKAVEYNINSSTGALTRVE